MSKYVQKLFGAIMDMSEGTHVKGCGFDFDVAPSLVQIKCPLIYQRSESVG